MAGLAGTNQFGQLMNQRFAGFSWWYFEKVYSPVHNLFVATFNWVGKGFSIHFTLLKGGRGLRPRKLWKVPDHHSVTGSWSAGTTVFNVSLLPSDLTFIVFLLNVDRDLIGIGASIFRNWFVSCNMFSVLAFFHSGADSDDFSILAPSVLSWHIQYFEHPQSSLRQAQFLQRPLWLHLQHGLIAVKFNRFVPRPSGLKCAKY